MSRNKQVYCFYYRFLVVTASSPRINGLSELKMFQLGFKMQYPEGNEDKIHD